MCYGCTDRYPLLRLLSCNVPRPLSCKYSLPIRLTTCTATLALLAERARAGGATYAATEVDPRQGPPATFCAPLPQPMPSPWWPMGADTPSAASAASCAATVPVDGSGGALIPRYVMPSGTQMYSTMPMAPPNAVPMHAPPTTHPLAPPPGAPPNSFTAPMPAAQPACSLPAASLPTDAPGALVCERLVGTYESVRELLRLLLGRGGRELDERAMLEAQLNDAARCIAQLRALAPECTTLAMTAAPAPPPPVLPFSAAIAPSTLPEYSSKLEPGATEPPPIVGLTSMPSNVLPAGVGPTSAMPPAVLAPNIVPPSAITSGAATPSGVPLGPISSSSVGTATLPSSAVQPAPVPAAVSSANASGQATTPFALPGPIACTPHMSLSGLSCGTASVATNSTTLALGAMPSVMAGSGSAPTSATQPIATPPAPALPSGAATPSAGVPFTYSTATAGSIAAALSAEMRA